jgi:hypothetical protein
MANGRKPGAWRRAGGAKARGSGRREGRGWRRGTSGRGERGTGIDGPLETKSPAGVNPRGANNRVGNLATVASYCGQKHRKETKETQGKVTKDTEKLCHVSTSPFARAIATRAIRSTSPRFSHKSSRPA